MAKYEAVETVHAEQWDGTVAGARYFMGELKHHGIKAEFHPEYHHAGLSIITPACVTFPGYTIHKHDYLIKAEDGTFYVRGAKFFEAKFKKVG